MIIAWVMLIIFVLAFLFRKRIGEEMRLLSRKEVEFELEKHIGDYFVPYTGKERYKLLKEHLQFLKNVQIKLDDSLIAKYFVNYRDKIESVERNVKENASDANSDTISFSTPDIVPVTASGITDVDDLEEFACVVDMHFEDSAIEIYAVSLENRGDVISIVICCTCKDPEAENFQELVDDISQMAFHEKKVELKVEIEEKALQFTSTVEALF